MRLTRLRVFRLPGIGQSFTLEPQPGMNIITGPNGSGKSSVTRAVFRLLWPSLTSSENFEVTAVFEGSDRTWTVTGGPTDRVEWEISGQKVAPPPLPSAQVAASYRLGLLDLNLAEAGVDDRALARHLRRQMDGGFDLAQVTQELFPAAPQLGLRDFRRWQETRDEVRELKNRYQMLASQERGLAALETQVLEARQAGQRAEVLETLIARNALQNELALHQAQLENFLPGVESVLPDDPRRLHDLGHKEQQARLDGTRLQQKLGDMADQQAARSWPSGFDPLRVGDQVAHLLDEAVALDRDLKALERQMAGKKPPGKEPPAGPAVDRETYRQLLDRHARLSAAEATRAAAQDMCQRLEADPGRLSWKALALLVAGSGLVIVGQVVALPPHLPPWVISATGVILACLGSFFLGRRWLSGNKAAAAWWQTERSRSDLEATRVREEIASLSRQHGLDLEQPHLFHDLKALGVQLESQEAARQLRQEKEEAENQLQEKVVRIRQLLLPLGEDALTTLDEARAAARQLARRREDWHRQVQDLANLRTRLESTQRELVGFSDQIQAIASRLQLPVDESLKAKVLQMVNDKPAWKATGAAIQHCRHQLADAEKFLTAHRDVLDLEATLQHDSRIVELQRHQERALAAREQELVQEWTQLHTDLKNARQADDLETASARQEQARQELADRREEARDQALGQLLLGEVRQQSETRSRPAVLEEAQQLFHKFTAGRYALMVHYDEDGQGRFLARDHDQDVTCPLGHLSDGTRAQLLLAVRLGFIFRSESESHPPLFLDDGLAASDPERFAAVASGLGQLAKQQDRQVFFLTADPVRAQAWNRALENAGCEPAHTIDLARVRRLGQAAGLAELQPAAIPPIPRPEGQAPEVYGRTLGVPRLDPWSAVEATHLFYLLTDELELLHRVLEAGLPTLGRWTHRSELEPGLSAEEAALIDFRTNLWERVLEAWRVGRARPVPRSVLAESGAVSATMQERAETVLEACQHDGAAFLAALAAGKVPRFRQDKTNQLQAYLELEGFLDGRPTLDDDALVDHVRARTEEPVRFIRYSAEQLRAQILGWARSLDRSLDREAAAG